MKKTDFENKYRLVQVSQAELNRKWQVHLREQEDNHLLELAAQATMGGVGGGTEIGYVDDYVDDYFE
jgi:hypothetical protein